MKRKRHQDGNNFLGQHRKHAKKSSASRAVPINNNRRIPTTNDMLKLALERVCALQAELARGGENSDDDDYLNNDGQVDPETAGFAACAIETFRFLAGEGLSENHPVVQQLTQHLLGDTPPPDHNLPQL